MVTMTAIELGRAIKEGHIGVEEATKMYLDRIEKYDGKDGLNSVAELYDDCIEQARKMDSKASRAKRDEAMFGLPVLVKDNIDVAGLHTTAGSLALEDNIAKKDAHVIENLRRNGALILGKTNMTEFANYTANNMPGGYSSRGGQVIHAYDHTKDASGSSSGSAVAMSAGFCSAAVGTDTSFSIVGCVTEHGVTGVKPTYGSLSKEGIIPISSTLDSPGPITRNLSDALLVYSCMRDEPLPTIKPLEVDKMRIAINHANYDRVSKEQLARYDKVLNKLKEDKVQVGDIDQPYTKYLGDLMRLEFKRDLEKYLSNATAKRKTLREIVDLYESNPEKMMKYGDNLLHNALHCNNGIFDEETYLQVMKERERMKASIINELQDYDVVLMTGPTSIMHFVGIPSLALGLCMAEDHTPRGIILYGADERKLFAAALTIEQYCDPIDLPTL